MRVNSSNRYQIENIDHVTIKELDSWFQRGDVNSSFYTSILNLKNKEFLRDNYLFDPNGCGLWINQQDELYIPFHVNNTPNHLGFLYLPQDSTVELVFFPGKTSKVSVNIEKVIKDTIEKKLEHTNRLMERNSFPTEDSSKQRRDLEQLSLNF